MLIVAVLVAVFTVGYAFAWFFEKKDANFELTGASAGAYFDVTSGNGTSEDEAFIISNATHMRNLAVLQNTGRFRNNKYYFRIKDDVTVLNMGSLWLPPIGNDDEPFIGDFNGNGKTIANLKVTTDKALLTETSYPNQAAPGYEFSQSVGLFGNTGKDSKISNFILDNPHVVVGAVGVNNNRYKEGSAKVVGIAVGHVAGLCTSIGVRATDVGPNTGDGKGSTTLDVRVTGYSTFNSILGELGEGVESSITGGGHVAGSGTGGSGNAFGANIDINGLVDRLKLIHNNGEASWYLPKLGDYYLDDPDKAGTYATTLASMEKMPFTVGADSTYAGATAKETLAINNIGYALGNQTKFYSKTYDFGEPMTLNGNTYVHTDKVIPKWIYKRIGTYGADYSTSSLKALTASEMAALPQNLKNDIFPAEGETSKTLDSIAISQTYSNVGAQVYPRSDANNQWSPHGQISWNGNTYGLGFSMTDYKGYAVDENGKLYAANGNYIGDDGYDVDENGIYAVDPNSYPDFPYVVYSVGTAWPNDGVAYDNDGNAYYRYNPNKSGLYVYGILQDGYLKTGNNYQYYVAPVAGWDLPIALIDSNGYAMYAPGVYYDVSGNIVNGAYVKDTNDLYIAADENFKMPISQIVNGYAQDADGNYYGVITLNGKTVYCYLGSDGITADYNGYYLIDENNFIVKALNVDSNGFVKFNDTDYYGSYNGISGYVDANGYFYDANHKYVVTDESFGYVVKNADASGFAMTADGVYFGKHANAYGYLNGNYFYTVEFGQNVYVVNDSNFHYAVNNIDEEDGYAMDADGNYYGKYDRYNNGNYLYGVLYISNGKTYLQQDGKYIGTDGNMYEFIDGNGHFKYAADSEFYYGKTTEWTNDSVKLSADGYIYDESLDAKTGYAKGYYIPAKNNGSDIIGGYHICEDDTSENYGYFISNTDDSLYINEYTHTALKAWGYTAEEIKELRLGNQYYSWNPAAKGYFISAIEGGEKIKVEQGEKISVEEGTKTQAIADSEINGIKGQFITPKEIEKIKVVTETVGANDKLERVLAKQSQPVALYEFLSGVALPNQGIWFKPSIAGTIRILLFADTTGKGITLVQGHRPSATKENPFIVDYGISGGDITAKEVAKCDLPAYVLCYFEYTISQEEIDDGRYEYWIIKNDSGGGAGANFVYLDLGASAPDDDTSAVVPDKVSAVDFIYDGVEISQSDVNNTDIKMGDFIVNTSNKVERYESSKTSVYFDGITKVLKVVYVRLHNESDKHSGKTICLEHTSTTDLEEVYATYATYVCPEIKGGTGTVGGGGGGTDIPNPGPDTPEAPTLTVTSTSLSMTVGGSTQKITATASSGATITYSSDKPNIAEVDDEGNVTAKAAGTATITVTATDGNGKTATKTVSVTVTGGTQTGGGETKTFESVTISNDSVDLGFVTLSKSSSGGESLALTERSVSIDGKAITKYIKGKAMDFTAGDTAIHIKAYCALSNSAGSSLQNGTITPSTGTAISYDKTKDYVLVEFDVAANSTVTLTPSGSNRLNILCVEISS